ncbi:MAG: hypothetical protein FJX47_17090 [Alphaproteobacteria bacterium]|nr:hypothetical protein [Alphaproteobacteria bacterium]
MPTIWLEHNKTQLFLNVAILSSADLDALEKGVFKGPPQMFRALVDTGATVTCLTASTAAKVGLLPGGKLRMSAANGAAYRNYYLFHVGFLLKVDLPQQDGANSISHQWHIHAVPALIQGAEFNAGPGFDVLLGMDMISIGNLIVGSNGQYSWSW